MKLAQLLDDNFHMVLKELKAQKIPSKTAYALKGIDKRIEQELMKYEEVRRELLLKYGKKDEANNLIINDDKTVILEDQTGFLMEMAELVSVDIDIGSIAIDSLGDKVELSVNDLTALGGLVN